MSFFLFRCDASLEIGTGHVMRCLTLANALRLQGSVCRFVCKEFLGNLQERIKQDGFEVVCLPPALSEIIKDQEVSNLPKHFRWLGGSWQDDAEQTIAAIGPNKPKWLIVDHYGIDGRWEKTLRPHVENIMVIDDLADRAHDCDLLLDQNLVANMDQRYEGLLPQTRVRLIGPKYALLQPEFAELRKKAKVREGPVNRILIYFGGADKDNLTGKTLKALESIKNNDITVDVVINPKSPFAEEVKKQISNNSKARCYENLPTLAYLMIIADLSVGAAGSTSWERCCLGLPSLIAIMAKNQIEIANELSSKSAAFLIGTSDKIDVDCISESIKGFIESKVSKDASSRCMKLCDGFGVKRVSEKLIGVL